MHGSVKCRLCVPLTSGSELLLIFYDIAIKLDALPPGLSRWGDGSQVGLLQQQHL